MDGMSAGIAVEEIKACKLVGSARARGQCVQVSFAGELNSSRGFSSASSHVKLASQVANCEG